MIQNRGLSKAFMHISVFPVRHYECDAYGHLNNIVYVRYLQQAALDADAVAGDDPARANASPPCRQTRRLDIEYLRPVRYGDTVEVTVALREIDDETQRRAYTFRLAGADDLVAQAESEATCLADTDWEPAPTAVALALPTLPSPPAGIFAMRHVVSWQDLDMTRRVDDATLLGLTETCGMAVIAAHGWPAERMAAAGFAIILRRHQVQRLAPIALNDDVEIATWASDVKRVSATRHFTIRRARDGALLARIDTLGVWVDLATGRPIRIPSQLLVDFAPNLV